MSVSAGEAIDFSGAKSKVDSSLDNRLSKEKASAANRRGLTVDAQQSLEKVAQPQVVGPNRKEEKRRKDEELEKKTWILVDRGELQNSDKADANFGVHDDAMESEKTAADIWFSRKDDRSPKAPHQPSAGPRAPSSERPVRPSVRPEADQKPEPRTKEADNTQITPMMRELEVRTSISDSGAKDFLAPRTGSAFDSVGGDRSRRLDGGLRLGNSDFGRSTLLPGPGLGRDSLARPNPPSALSGGSVLNGASSRLGEPSFGSGFNSTPISPSFNNAPGQNGFNQPRNAFGVESSRSGR
jgi:hypothetical protein